MTGGEVLAHAKSAYLEHAEGNMMNELEAYINEREDRFLEDLKGWLRIPGISTLPEHTADVHRAADYAADQLLRNGIEEVEVIQTQGHPLVFGQWLHAPDKPIVFIYGHYDVQPADPLDEWYFPPFEPTVRNGNLYARGACDDKGQVMIVLKAFEALMAVHKKLPLNIRVLLEGEEESGGASIEVYVREVPERLNCDAVLICDSEMPRPETPALITSLRGLVYTEVEVQGARHDLHSGAFGGIAPNPLHALAIILSKLKDEQGHIHMPQLYEQLRRPTEREKDFWKHDPLHFAEALRQEMGVSELVGEPEHPPLERIAARPTLEVHGIAGGFTGEGAKTVIPAKARAKISLRFPVGLKSKEVFGLFEKAVKAAAPGGVEVTVRKIYSGEGVVVELDNPAMIAATAALKEIYGKEPLYLHDGGSLPVAALFSEVLLTPVVLMGFGLPDDHAHAPNEKLSLGQFSRGIRTVARFLQLMSH